MREIQKERFVVFGKVTNVLGCFRVQCICQIKVIGQVVHRIESVDQGEGMKEIDDAPNHTVVMLETASGRVGRSFTEQLNASLVVQHSKMLRRIHALAR